MGTKLSETIDQYAAWISNGKTIEAHLAEYPKMRSGLEPLLYTALFISGTPRVQPSDDFKSRAKARLLARIRRQTDQAMVERSVRRAPLWRGRFAPAFARVAGVTMLVTVTMLLFMGMGVPQIGKVNAVPAPPALASQCTLSTLCGTVEVQNPGSNSWQQGADSIALAAGTRLRTAAGSQAMITFFDSIITKLEPNTGLEIQQFEYGMGKATSIVLKQWSGMTWSRVTKMAGADAHYVIETPSASITVHGTIFTTEVGETGATKVATTKGLVSVAAQGLEVYVAAGQETEVGFGAVPSPPVIPMVTNIAPIIEGLPADKGLADNDKGPPIIEGSPADKGLTDNDKGPPIIKGPADTAKGPPTDKGLRDVDIGPVKANGQGQGNAYGHDKGNANGQGNGNANAIGQDKGNANGQDNANANGQDNGNANGQDNGNANGQDNANANGQDNGNANGQDNANASGQDNGNASGQDNANASGQDNANASGQDNANANGQDNGNAKGGDKGDKGGGKGDKGGDKGDKGGGKGDKGGGKGDKGGGKGDKGGGKGDKGGGKGDKGGR